jgi:spore coat protein H
MKRWLKRIAITLALLVGMIVAAGGTLAWLATRGYLQNWGLRQGQAHLLKDFPELAKPARSWTPEKKVEAPRSADELYSLSNIWPARLAFTASEWKNIAPSTVPPVRDMFRDGRMVLRNPKASRSGLAGVIGIDFNWATASSLEFAGVTYTNVAARYRGNGTYINSLFGPKQSFKVDLNKFAKGQSLAGLDELNFVNSVPDDTYMRDALAQQLFRNLGVAAPRTGYGYLTLDAPKKFTNQALGLYVLIENIDGDFAKERFGSKKTPIFKPVTYELFQYLGDDWKAYEAIYDLKTEATTDQLRRVIDLARLVTHGDDAEFERELPDYVDLVEFSAFVAGHVLLSSCDGFLANGQNYYVYLDPRSNKFGFISWDQDHSFGEFGYVGTAEQREQMKIWEPYLYDFRFLARAMKTEAFRKQYRAHLEKALKNHFTEEKLFAEVDRLTALLRPAVEAESSFRLKRFDLAVSDQWHSGPRDGAPEGPHSPVHQIKRFIRNRIQSVRAQLDGQSEGAALRRHRH